MAYIQTSSKLSDPLAVLGEMVIKYANIPDHVHHENDVEDDEKVVRVPEDLVVGHPEQRGIPRMF